MTDLTLKFKFTDRGGNAVYDVMKPEMVLDLIEQTSTPSGFIKPIGQVRIPPDPRIAELEAERDKLRGINKGLLADLDRVEKES